MSINSNQEKSGMPPRDIAIIAAVVVAVLLAVMVIYRTVKANSIQDVIVIKGAKGAKPMPGDKGGAEAGEGGASDRPLSTIK